MTVFCDPLVALPACADISDRDFFPLVLYPSLVSIGPLRGMVEDDFGILDFRGWPVVFPAFRRIFGAGVTDLDFCPSLARPRSSDRTSDGGSLLLDLCP